MVEPPNPRLRVLKSGKDLSRSHKRILELPMNSTGLVGGACSLSSFSNAAIEFSHLANGSAANADGRRMRPSSDTANAERGFFILMVNGYGADDLVNRLLD